MTFKRSAAMSEGFSLNFLHNTSACGQDLDLRQRMADQEHGFSPNWSSHSQRDGRIRGKYVMSDKGPIPILVGNHQLGNASVSFAPVWCCDT